MARSKESRANSIKQHHFKNYFRFAMNDSKVFTSKGTVKGMGAQLVLTMCLIF